MRDWTGKTEESKEQTNKWVGCSGSHKTYSIGALFTLLSVLLVGRKRAWSFPTLLSWSLPHYRVWLIQRDTATFPHTHSHLSTQNVLVVTCRLPGKQIMTRNKRWYYNFDFMVTLNVIWVWRETGYIQEVTSSITFYRKKKNIDNFSPKELARSALACTNDLFHLDKYMRNWQIYYWIRAITYKFYRFKDEFAKKIE